MGKKDSVKLHRPLHDGILVKSFDVEEKTDGGIIKPSEVIEKERNTIKDNHYREVVAVGPEVKNVKIGDMVAFNRMTPFYYNFQEGQFMQYFEHQCTAIYTEDDRDLVDNSNYMPTFRG